MEFTDRRHWVVLNGQLSTWTNVNTGELQGYFLGLLLFLIYINNLSDGLSTNAKFFADDVSLFSVIHDCLTSANDLNKNLEMIHNWAFFYFTPPFYWHRIEDIGDSQCFKVSNCLANQAFDFLKIKCLLFTHTYICHIKGTFPWHGKRNRECGCCWIYWFKYYWRNQNNQVSQ